MRGPAFWLIVPWAVWLAACDPPSHEYLVASAISIHGFARDTTMAQAMSSKVVRVWGFVDQANLYGDMATREVLDEWWSGDGPDPATWRFNLKGSAADPAGWSFPVYVRVDGQTDVLLRSIVADARAGRPTKVYVTGTLRVFHAPANTVTLTGVYLQVQGSSAVLVRRPSEEPR